MNENEIKKEFNEISLNEMSLSRLWKHASGATERPIGFITAWRTWKGKDKDGTNIPYSDEEKKERNNLLEKIIKSKNWGFVKVKGGYIENFGTDMAKDVVEDTFMIIGDPKDNQELRAFLVKLGEKFNQDSVLYVSPKRKAVLIGTSDTDEVGNKIEFPGYGKIVPVGDWHTANDLDMFFTKWKGKKFSFKECDLTISYSEDAGLSALGRLAKHVITHGGKVYESYEDFLNDPESFNKSEYSDIKKDFFDKMDNK